MSCRAKPEGSVGKAGAPGQTHLPAALRWPQPSSPAQTSQQLGLSWHNLPPSLQRGGNKGQSD